MNEHDDFTSLLTQSLTDQSDTMVGSHLGLAEVKGRARSIRRRRATGAMVAVAAAVAIIVPTVDLADHTGGKPEPAPATQVPTPTRTATPVDGHQPAPGVLDVSDLPPGAAPQLDYVAGGRLHVPDGSDGAIETRYTPYSFVEMEDGSRVWLTTHDGAAYVELQDSDGGFEPPVRSGSFTLAVNPAHSISAWISPTGQVSVYEGRASQPHTYGDPVPGTEWKVAAVSGSSCSLACTVYVNGSDTAGTRTPYEVTDSATQPLRDGGYLVVNDVSDGGLTVGLTSISDFRTCSKLLGGGEFVGADTCKHQLLGFSPDGRHVWGTQTYFDGPGTSSIAVFDPQGKPLFERRSDEAHQATIPVPGPVWEDNSRLLVPVFQDGSWSLVRIYSDGSMEYAVPPEPGSMESSPFVLPTGGDLSAIG
jgi:hypothetical protein